jgi:hypothetical protein
MNDERIDEKAREALRAGRIPCRMPDKSWGGRGFGAPCRICGAAVGNDELELELEFHADGGQPPQSYNVHVQCFNAWGREWRQLEMKQRDATQGSQERHGLAQWAPHLQTAK